MYEDDKMRAFWDIAPCCLVEADRHFRCVLPPSSGRPPKLHGTIHTRRLENVKSHTRIACYSVSVSCRDVADICRTLYQVYWLLVRKQAAVAYLRAVFPSCVYFLLWGDCSLCEG
jgi:hypothetical protein